MEGKKVKVGGSKVVENLQKRKANYLGSVVNYTKVQTLDKGKFTRKLFTFLSSNRLQSILDVRDKQKSTKSRLIFKVWIL